MIASCFASNSLVEIMKILFVVISFSISGVLIFILKRYNTSTKTKIALIYSHIITLFFPFTLLTASTGCGLLCISCYSNILQVFVLALPPTILISTIAGFIVIPAFFISTNRSNEIRSGKIHSFVKSSSKKLGIKQPKTYLIDKQDPIAFSFRKFKSAIFLSVGLFDILRWKEVQSVILHELGHIKQRSSALKLSTFILRIFSPLSILLRFHHNNSLEEKKADKIAINIQGTDRHLKSARRKISEYDSA